VHNWEGLSVLGPRGFDLGDPDLNHDQPCCLDFVESVPRQVIWKVVVGWKVVGEEVVIVEEADDLGE
jgi:hypothetical protein